MLDLASLLNITFNIRHNGQSGNSNLTLKINACVSVGYRALSTLRSEKHISSFAKERSHENCISLNAGIFFPPPSPHHHRHVANMELSHLLTRSGLTHLEVFLVVAHGFLRLLVLVFSIPGNVLRVVLFIQGN